MTHQERGEAEAIVLALANIDPTVTAAYECFFCSAGDPVDRPTRHDEGCLHLRATRWTERRWEREEGWREDALRRIEAVQQQLRQGQPASRDLVERTLAELETSLNEPQ